MTDTDFRLGTPVTVVRQDGKRAKLAVCGYSRHVHFGERGVVTDVVGRDDHRQYVVRFDDLGIERETFAPEELERAPDA